MTRLSVLTYPNPKLRVPSEPVRDYDNELQTEIDDLLDTFVGTSAIGLCAPQIGVQKQILVMDLSERTEAPKLFVNPEFRPKGGFGVVEERCLSVPGTVVLSWRATQVAVSAQDRWGHPFETELTGMEAVCLQHEMDHFRGKLLVDKMFFVHRAWFELDRRWKARSTEPA